MKSNTFIKLITISTIAGFASTPAVAQAFVWDGDVSKSWDNKKNWSFNGSPATSSPTAGSDVEIPDISGVMGAVFPEFDVASLSIASLDVEPSATLNVATNKELTVTGATNQATISGLMILDGAGSKFFISGAEGLQIVSGGELRVGSSAEVIVSGVGGMNDIAGLLDLNGTGATLTLSADSDGTDAHTIDGTIEIASGALIDVLNDMDFEGTGQIEGQGSTAKIQLAIGTTKLTNELATAGEGIRGQLQIVKASGLGANPTFMNKGVVEARGGVLELTSAVALSDSAAAEFRVDASGTLRFSKSATSLAGDFFVVSGEMDFVQSVTTSGALDYTDLNTITIASGKAFQFASYAAGSDCSDLHQAVAGNGDFIINATVTACP